MIGAGAAKRLSAVRWGVAGNIAVAWIATLPVAALLGAGTYGLATLFGSALVGSIAIIIGLAAALAYIARLHRTLTLDAGA